MQIPGISAVHKPVISIYHCAVSTQQLGATWKGSLESENSAAASHGHQSASPWASSDSSSAAAANQ